MRSILRLTGQLIWVITGTLAIPAAAQVSPESWFAAGFAPFDQSAPVQAIELEIVSARESVRESLAESPFTLETRLAASGFQPNPDLQELAIFGRRFFSIEGSTGVRYHTRSGLDIGLRGSLVQNRYQEPEQFKKVDLPYSVSLDVSYDLLTGGSTGRERTIAAIRTERAWSNFFLRYQSLLDVRVKYMQLLTDLFAVACKISRLQAVQVEVGKTILEGKVQVQTKTISYKDYLNFQDLENSFARRLVSLQSQQRALTERLAVWGPTVSAGLPNSSGAQCPAELGATLARAQAAVVERGRRQLLARAFPSFAAGQAALREAELQVRLAGLNRTLGLVPFLSGEVSRQPFAGQTLASVTGGVSLSWNIAGARGRHESAAANAAQKSALASLEATALANLSTLNGHSVEVESQQAAYAVQKKSLETSRELLKTLVAQRAIGLVDSLSFTSAYLNSVETGFAVIDSWAQLEKTIFALKTYQTWVGEDPGAGHE